MFYIKPWISKITSTIPVEYDEENHRTLREVETRGIEIHFLGLHFSIGVRVKETDFRPLLKKETAARLSPINSLSF